MRRAFRFWLWLPLLACGLSAAAQTGSQEAEQPHRLRSSAEERESLSITIYNQGFGLVRERRSLELGRGRVRLDFGDVAATIQPETVHIRSLGKDTLHVLEQNYQYDLLSPQKLLEKYVGRRVKVLRWNEVTGRDEERDAEVLAVNGGTILKIGNEITFNYPGRISFPEIPENLIAKPTLSWLLDSGQRRQDLEVSYLARQLDWKADYVFVINADDTRGDLTGWVTLTNQSGASYEDARLKLVAGQVQRVTPEVDRRVRPSTMALESARAGFAEEGFFEYHLYTLERPTTILHNEQKQVTLLEGSDISVDKKLIFYGASQYYRGSYGQVISNQKVGVYLDFQNSEENRLGMALPKGIVRVYKADSEGSLQFIGEDEIDHTPRDEEIRIKMGESFDVVGDRRQMRFKSLGRCASESTWEVELRNHKDEDARVEVFEPIGGDWEILSSSHPPERLDANTFKFEVEIAARGRQKIDYRVHVRWC
ncbi:MAG: DUF4139 domain-containing protein [Myxococcota bacterium]